MSSHEGVVINNRQNDTNENIAGELSINNDQLEIIARRAEARVAAINSIMKAAVKMTTHLDWVKIGDNPYLMETGASKIARLFDVSWQITPPYKIYDPDGSGHYTYRANGRFFFAGAETDASGLRSTRDEFFIGAANKTKKDDNGNIVPIPQKKPQDVDERDVMQAAYTNCLNNGIKRTIPGLRNITMEYLQECGIDTSKMKGYGFNSGQQTPMSDAAIDQRIEIERMLKEMYGEKWIEGLQWATSFPGQDGQMVQGKTDINKVSEKQMPFTFKKIETEYKKWVKSNGNRQQSNNTNVDTGQSSKNS